MKREERGKDMKWERKREEEDEEVQIEKMRRN